MASAVTWVVGEGGGPRPPQAPPAAQEARPHQVPGRPVCPPGAAWDPVAGVCRGAHPQSPPRHLGLTIPQGVQQAHAKGILVVWNSAHPVLGNYGPSDAATPGWSERDGIVLHAFAQWWTGTPKLAWQNDKADSSGVIVAELTPDHLAALDAWLAAQGQQLPGAQAIDVAASKALLVLWSRTDSPVHAIADYGLNPAEFAPAWSSRDTTELGLFQTWWNAQGKPAVPTGGALDVASSNALKAWFAERAANAPSGWVAPGAQPQTTPAPSPACKAGEVWDAANKACQPLPTSMVTPGGGGGGGGGGGAAKSRAVWWVLGGLAAVGAVALVYSSRSIVASVGLMNANPRLLSGRGWERAVGVYECKQEHPQVAHTAVVRFLKREYKMSDAEANKYADKIRNAFRNIERARRGGYRS